MPADTMTKESIKDPVVKPGAFDITKRVTVKTTDKHPFHKEGKDVSVAPLVAEKYKLNGWAK